MLEFYVNLLDSGGLIVGDGPLTTVLRLDDRRSLDAIGMGSFELPAEDPRTAFIAAGAQFDFYDRLDGYLGRFLYKSKTLRAGQGSARLQVECYDQLKELAQRSVNFRRTYNNVSVESVVADLVAVAAGWSANVDMGIGDTTITYEGESALLAIDALRDRWNQHYRLGASRVLEFGAFGALSDVVLTNLRGQIQSEIEQNENVALVESVSLVEESDEIFNRVVPLAAGQGTAQLTIEVATAGSYAVETGVNDDGSNFYYIEDAASVAAYGRRDKVLSFPQIRPITNSDANILNAANALKLAAEAYIARHTAPRVAYDVSLRALRKNIKVGDLVRLQYRGVVENYAYVDIDNWFYVMDISRQRSATGERQARLTIATIAERRTSDTDVVVDVLADLRALKVHVPITLAYSPVGPYVKRIGSASDVEFTVRIGSEVVFLNYAKLRFRTEPLKSSVSGGLGGGGTTVTSGASSSSTTASGGGQTSSDESTHTHTIGNHQHNVTTNDHTHDVEVVDRPSLEGTPVYFNETNHYFNSTLTSGTDVSTSSAGGGETVTSANGGATTSSAGSAHSHTVSDHTHGMAHTHQVTISAHTHSVIYGIYEDTNYPQNISLAINGVDVTAALGGPWAPVNATVEVEVDITDYLVNAVGGLRQNHRCLFSCTTAQGELEFEVDMLVSIQAVVVS